MTNYEEVCTYLYEQAKPNLFLADSSKSIKKLVNSYQNKANLNKLLQNIKGNATRINQNPSYDAKLLETIKTLLIAGNNFVFQYLDNHISHLIHSINQLIAKYNQGHPDHKLKFRPFFNLLEVSYKKSRTKRLLITFLHYQGFAGSGDYPKKYVVQYDNKFKTTIQNDHFMKYVYKKVTPKPIAKYGIKDLTYIAIDMIKFLVMPYPIAQASGLPVPQSMKRACIQSVNYQAHLSAQHI